MSDLFDAHWKNGLTLFNAGAFADAVSEWREASRLEPEDADVRYNLGIAYSEIGQHEAAIAEWREAIRLEPDHANAHIHLAYALSDAGCSAEAFAAVRAALRFDAQNSDLYTWLGYHLAAEAERDNEKAKWQAAGVAFEKATTLDPTNAYALRCLGTTLWRLGHRRQAIETLKAAVKADPANDEGYFVLGECQRRALHWRGFCQTVIAMNKLPISEEMARFYARVNRCTRRFQIGLAIGAGIAAILIWKRRQKRK